MSPADWTILALVLFIVVIDVVFIIRRERTFSNRFRNYGARCASVPFFFGVLAGHFWGPSMDPHLGWPLSVGLLVLSTALVGFLHHIVWDSILPAWTPLCYVPPGVIMGMALWPM